MDKVRSALQSFDNTANKGLSFLNTNDFISAALVIVLTIYAAKAAPKLPEYIMDLFDNAFVQLVIFFLIAYTAQKSPSVAIIAAIGVMVTIIAINKLKIDRTLTAIMGGHLGMGQPMDEVSIAEGPVGVEGDLGSEAFMGVSSAPCDMTANYRNSFYPQYVNMKPDAYMARYNGNGVVGYDPNASYATNSN